MYIFCLANLHAFTLLNILKNYINQTSPTQNMYYLSPWHSEGSTKCRQNNREYYTKYIANEKMSYLMFFSI